MIPQWQKIDLAKEIKEADQAIRKANKCADEGFKLAKEMHRQRLEKLLREKIEEQKILVNLSELNTYWAKKHLNKLRTTLFKVTGKVVHFGKLCIFISSLSLICMVARAETASYYTYESCKREGTSGIWTASGERFNENDLTCASWDYPFGTKVKVTNISNGKSVICLVNDRGPNKRLYNKGRKIDLSKGAFEKIADLREGVIKVNIAREK